MRCKENITVLYVILIIGIFFYVGCDDEENLVVSLSVEPSSLILGSTTEIEILSDENFFFGNIKKSFKSDKNLILKNVQKKNPRHITAISASNKYTTPGLHRFKFEINQKAAYVDISVIMPDSGPGEITVQGTNASSGVDSAVFRILGTNTDFDDFCSLSIRGADGMSIQHLIIKSPTEIDVIYSISLEQKPTIADFVLKDGNDEYTFPFTIVRHKDYNNNAANPPLLKGQEGQVFLENDAATIDYSTHVFPKDTSIIFGEVSRDSVSGFYFPIKVPFDYKDEKASFLLKTYTDGGSHLEHLNIEVELLDPAYLVASPAILELEKKTAVDVRVETQGVDLTHVEKMLLQDDEQIQLLSFAAIAPELGTITLETGDDPKPGKYKIKAVTSSGSVDGFIVLTQLKSMKAYFTPKNITAGDSVYLPISVQSGDLKNSSIETPLADGIKTVELILIDDYSVVAKIDTYQDTFAGQRNIILNGEIHKYPISITIVESEI